MNKALDRAMLAFTDYLGPEAATWNGEVDDLDMHQQYILKDEIVKACNGYEDLISLLTCETENEAWCDYIDSLLLNEQAIKTVAEIYAVEFDFNT